MCFVINPKILNQIAPILCSARLIHLTSLCLCQDNTYVYTRGHLRSIDIHHAIALDGRITSKREVTKGKAELIGGLFGLVQIEALMEEAVWEVGNISLNFCFQLIANSVFKFTKVIDRNGIKSWESTGTFESI